jgi:hypothetical protein
MFFNIAGRNGKINKQDFIALYDGTFFYEREREVADMKIRRRTSGRSSWGTYKQD